RVVAPVVGQAPAGQEALGHELVHRQQLDRGDLQVLQVAGGGLVAQAGVGTAQRGRYVRVLHGEALDVHVVEQGVGVRAAQRPGAGPGVGGGVDDQAAGHVGGRVGVAGGVGVAAHVPEHVGVVGHGAADRPGVRVEQRFGGVAADAGGRVVGARGPEAVGLPGAHAGDE